MMLLILICGHIFTVTAFAGNHGMETTKPLSDAERKLENLNLKLITAAKLGNVNAVTELIKRGADVNAATPFLAETPLHFVAFSGNVLLAQILLDHGASVNALSKDDETPLHAAVFNNKWEIVRVLIANGADINAVKSNTGLTPLHIAAQKGDVKVIAMLLANGASVNMKSYYGERTPLHYGVDNFDVVKILLDNGANVNALSNDLWTPLHVASKNGNLKVAKLLLARGADKHRINKKGRTPLHVAISNSKGTTKMVELLVKYHSRVNVQDNKGFTALHIAASLGYTKIVELLLKARADVYLRAKNGKDSWEMANDNHLEDTARLISDFISIYDPFGGNVNDDSDETDKTLRQPDDDVPAPLNHLIGDVFEKKIRSIGIGLSTFFTRVTSYIDWIESIVWPN